MVRVALTTTAMSLALVLAAGQPARASDLHWFYDNQQLQRDGDFNYTDNEAYRGTYRPEPEYSVYQPSPRQTRRQRHRYGDAQLSCLQGVELLRDYGFRHIEVVDCRNGHYLYEAVRGREPWRIQLSRESGELVNAEPFN